MFPATATLTRVSVVVVALIASVSACSVKSAEPSLTAWCTAVTTNVEAAVTRVLETPPKDLDTALVSGLRAVAAEYEKAVQVAPPDIVADTREFTDYLNEVADAINNDEFTKDQLVAAVTEEGGIETLGKTLVNISPPRARIQLDRYIKDNCS